MASEYLAFNGSFFSRQHKHSDDMGIQFFSDGKGLLTDAGFMHISMIKKRIGRVNEGT